MFNNISFGSLYNPLGVNRRHVEAKLVNPEADIEDINHEAPDFGRTGLEPDAKYIDFGVIGRESDMEHAHFGKIGTEPNVEHDDFGVIGKLQEQIELQELLGRSQVINTKK